jgi:O-antigen ligase/tetratricopeptide (TPR) repeat protein
VGTAQIIEPRSGTIPIESKTDVPVACDTIVGLGIVLLLILAPFGPLIGDERSLRIAEIIVAVISALWAGKILWTSAYGEPQPITDDSWRLLLPLGAMVLWFVVQLIPLPPALIRVFSPATYQVYEKSLPGWPAAHPYQSLIAGSSTTGLPIWRPLSLCPDLTLRDTLRFSSLAALMAIAAFYSFGLSRNRENRIVRRTAIAIIAVSTVVASWGLLSVLGAEIGNVEARATGPFVNPDHFANYLALMTPLALAGLLYPSSFVEDSWRDLFRIMSGVAFLVASCAIFMSLSRAGWIIWALGCFLLIRFTVFSHHFKAPNRGLEIGASLGRRTRIAIGCAIVLLFLTGAAYLLGDRGEQLLGDRLNDTVSSDASFASRAQVWRASLPMLRDFPLVGVGLGSWPEIFPRYQPAPYDRGNFWNAAHNDYLQFFIETGIVGAALFLLLWSQLVVYVVRARAALSSHTFPLFAALLAGAAAMAAHELADFSFRITPNAVLFCVMAGFALRISRTNRLSRTNQAESRRAKRSWRFGMAGMVAATLMFVCAMSRSTVAYPYGIYATENRAYWQSSAQAKPALADLIAAHPGRADTHLALIHSLAGEKRWDEIDREIDAAIFLQPANATARDWHVYRLEQSGRMEDALAEITQSLTLSPNLESHDYLTREHLEKLSDGEKSAVELGFQHAIARGYSGAIPQLAECYALSDRYEDEAALYLKAASEEQEPSRKERFLIAAGEAFGKAGESKEARSAFQTAAGAVPSDARPYTDMVSVVDGPAKDVDAARATVETGVGNGADPIILYTALANLAQNANRPEIAGAALDRIIAYAPTFQNNVRLAEFYLASGKSDRAVDTLRKAVMIEPDSADAYVRLAGAEEAAYLYADADRDYSHALSLEPNNPMVKSRYAEFQQRTADKGSSPTDAPN